uniref:Uncharacterized protein n=1 Tax=Rhizophora mucronata TaxID=61149 RepID=A0A2P2M286_RHIMU
MRRRRKRRGVSKSWMSAEESVPHPRQNWPFCRERC